MGRPLAAVLVALAYPVHAQVVGPEQAIGVDVARIDSQPVIAAHGQTVVMIAGHPGIPCASRFGWTYSLDGGATWSPYGLLGANTNLFGQPALTADASGQFYLANARCQAGAYRMSVTRGTVSGGAFVWDARVDVTPTSAPELLDLPSIAAEPTTGAILLVYTARRHLGGVEYDAFVHFARSVDAGATWSTPVTLSSASAEGADLAVGPDGEVYVVWADRASEHVVGRKSLDQGVSFGPEFVVGTARSNYNTISPGWQGIYDRSHPEYPYGGFFASDFPSVAVDRSAGPNRGRVYVTWTEMASGVVGTANGQEVRLEGAEGRFGTTERRVGAAGQGCVRRPSSYYAGAVPISIGANIAGGFPSGDQGCGGIALFKFTAPLGTTLWIQGDGLFGPLPPGVPPQPFTYHVQCGPDTTQLVDIGAPVLWDAFQLDYSPPFVMTLPSAGPYYIRVVGGGAYESYYSMSLRSYVFATNDVARDQRDVVLARSGDGGVTWSPKVRVNDDPPGSDNALADLAVDGFGNLHVAWYDRREDQACGGTARTFWAMSNDGGATFAASRPLSGGPSYWPFPYSVGYTIGDKLGLWGEGERVHVVWADFRAGGNPDILHAMIRDLVTSTVVTRFEAVGEAGGVRVRWSVSDASDLVAMTIERAPGGANEFAPLPAGGRAVDGARFYEIVDVDVDRGETYLYRLALEWRDGRTTYGGPIAVTLSADAGGFAFGRPAPTPFTDAVAFDLTLAVRGVVDVRVYDLLGHEVAALQRGELGAGRHVLAWNGHGHGGHRLAPGMYVVRARQGDRSTSRNVLMVR